MRYASLCVYMCVYIYVNTCIERFPFRLTASVSFPVGVANLNVMRKDGARDQIMVNVRSRERSVGRSVGRLLFLLRFGKFFRIYIFFFSLIYFFPSTLTFFCISSRLAVGVIFSLSPPFFFNHRDYVCFDALYVSVVSA